MNYQTTSPIEAEDHLHGPYEFMYLGFGVMLISTTTFWTIMFFADSLRMAELMICTALSRVILSFTGAENSYAAVDNWKICSSSRLTFTFKSYQKDGLILYQNRVHEGSESAFIEIKLVSGQLRMRLKFGDENLVSFSIGENLDDRWVIQCASAHIYRYFIQTNDT